MEVPDGLKKSVDTGEEELVEDGISSDKMKKRKNLTGFWDKFKDRLVDLFKEEEDHHFG